MPAGDEGPWIRLPDDSRCAADVHGIRFSTGEEAGIISTKFPQPLGTEFPATWSLDSTKHGFEKMESGFNGRAIDLAKFGLLFLHQGTWNGQQLISQK